MATFVKEDLDTLNAILTITIDQSDYEKNFKKTLEKHRKDSHLKGFRKGKTPLSYVKKMYGEQILMQEVNTILQEQLQAALKGVEIFGEPIPNEKQEQVAFDANKLGDFEFKFDLGLIPDFEIKGISKKSTYKTNRVSVSDKIVEEELNNARKRFGKRSNAENDIQMNDLVKVTAKELDGKALKEDGHEAEFSIAVDRAADKLAKALSKKKVGDTISFDIKDVEKDSEKSIINKYILGIEEDDDTVGDMFEAEITEVSRVELAEMNQEFFDKQFGEGVVTSEQEALDKFRIDLNASMQKNADAILFRDIQMELVKKNNFELPEEFLKRWIKISNEKPVSDEQIDREFPFFIEELRWSVLRGKLTKQFELKVSQEEIEAGFINALKSYGGIPPGLDESILKSYTQRLFQDKQAVQKQAEEIMGDKLFTAVTQAVKLDETLVDEKEIETIIKEANAVMDAENEARRKALNPEETVEA